MHVINGFPSKTLTVLCLATCDPVCAFLAWTMPELSALPCSHLRVSVLLPLHTLLLFLWSEFFLCYPLDLFSLTGQPSGIRPLLCQHVCQ